MDTVRSKDGTTIAFDRSGEGPALILVAGATATRLVEVSVAKHLAPYFTVFAYDRRGRGDSGDTLPYAIEREVEDIDALITEAGGSAFVFGHSSGAALALEAARVLSNRITKLALYEPPFIVDGSRPPVPANYLSHLTDLIASDRRGDAVEYFLIAAVGVPAEDVLNMRNAPMWGSLEAVAHTIVYDGTIMGDTMRGKPLPPERAASVSIPTLVMDGEASPVYMHHGARALVNLLPNGQHRRLAGQNHGPADDILVPVLVDFFKA